MRGRGIGLVLGLAGVIVAGTAGAQTAAPSASSSSSSVAPKLKPAVSPTTKPVAATTSKPVTATGGAKPAATQASGASKSGVAPVKAVTKTATTPTVAGVKPAVASGTSSLGTSSSVAAPPKPKPIPAQPKTVPAECLTINTTPFGALESLQITGPTHAPVHFDVEIASAPAQRGQGLMCRQKLPAGQGMLFEFPKASEQIFWMHDTVLPLDILYVAPDGHVISITKVAYPLSEKKLPSHGLANGVLEINAGLADKFGLKPGDQVVYPFFVPNVPPAGVSAATGSASSASSSAPSSGLAQ